ncbi:MAG: AAA family ATPase [Acidimicrobiia bacterium]
MDARRAPHAPQFDAAQRVALREWPLVGRDDELALATAALATHGCVVLTGDAGVGKTRLAREVLARVAKDGDRTEWVAATQSAATIPLGAVAQLVPEAAIGRGRDATLRGIVRVLQRDDDKSLLLGIDDAHLLDDASAALVQHLVAGQAASAVITMRSGESISDSIASLWKDGPAPLIALQTLARPEVEAVVTTALDDPVDGATLHFLWESSRGNALFLRELVRHGVESGALRCELGLWRWSGRLELSERLHQLLARRMGALSDGERSALELVAVGQPLTVDSLSNLGVAELVAQLERRGLVASPPGQSGVVAVAHPLFGEILREGMPSSRRREVQLALADAIEATCDGSPAEQFRIALWRVDAGDRTRPEQTRAAAMRALRLWEPVIGERLARAALESGPEMEAAYLLGGSLSDQNRSEEALDAFRFARTLAGSDRLRASVATNEAGVLSAQLGRLSDAERVLSETLEQVRDPDARAILEGGRAAIVVSGGFATTNGPEPLTNAVPTAVLAAVLESTAAGRLDLAVRIASERLATAPQWTNEFPKIELFLHLARTWALVLKGDLADAQVAADVQYATAVEDRTEFPRATWSLLRGMIHVAQGRPNTAMRTLLEAAAGFEVADGGFRRPSHACLALAQALAGDVAAAEQHLSTAAQAMTSFDGVFGVDVARARAWLMAARGEVSAAAAELRRVADDAAARNAWALEVWALHDAARFGRGADVVDRLEALSGLVDGAFVDNAAKHARALVDSDGAALDLVSNTFSFLTLDLFAAEASAAAARSHRHAGKRASAFAALERARELAARCESAQTPALEWADQPEDLTAREREIADMARSELASREIAVRLGITTRTVDNLLGRVYAKLGVSGRQELTEVLGRRNL